MTKSASAMLAVALCAACTASEMEFASRDEVVPLDNGAIVSVYARDIDVDGVHILVVEPDGIMFTSGVSGGGSGNFDIELKFTPREAPVVVDDLHIVDGKALRTGSREWSLADGTLFVIWPGEGRDSVVQLRRPAEHIERNMDVLSTFRIAFPDDSIIRNMQRR